MVNKYKQPFIYINIVGLDFAKNYALQHQILRKLWLLRFTPRKLVHVTIVLSQKNLNYRFYLAKNEWKRSYFTS